MKKVKVEITPTRKICILGLDKRSFKDLAWCAATYGLNRLFWVDGHVLCLEVYEKSFEHEIKNKEFSISQVCFAEFPQYRRIHEIDKSLQIPLVDVSDMKMFKSILTTILNEDKQDTL